MPSGTFELICARFGDESGTADGRVLDAERERMPIRRRLTTALTITALSAFGAHANSPRFGRNYGEWSALSESSKSAYAVGAFDALTLPDSSAETAADSRGLSACAAADGFTPKILAGLIDARYAAHPEEWSAGAASALTAALIDTYGTQMDSERRRSGLSPLTPYP